MEYRQAQHLAAVAAERVIFPFCLDLICKGVWGLTAEMRFRCPRAVGWVFPTHLVSRKPSQHGEDNGLLGLWEDRGVRLRPQLQGNRQRQMRATGDSTPSDSEGDRKQPSILPWGIRARLEIGAVMPADALSVTVPGPHMLQSTKFIVPVP